MIEKVVRHRHAYAQSTAEQPALITAGDTQQVLQDFYDDEYSAQWNRRWLVRTLKVPSARSGDRERMSQIFETAVEGFVADLRANKVTGLVLSKRAWAALALYRQILIHALQPKRQLHMLMGPICRLLANASGAGKEQYLPADKCGENVELAANCMPAYWKRTLDSVGQPVVDHSLAVPSPPVMFWICGEGFLHNGALFKHCCTQHGDYAEYRKRLF